MSEKHKVDLHLTSPQKNKFVKGLPFQMTANQCSLNLANITYVQYYQKKTITTY